MGDTQHLFWDAELTTVLEQHRSRTCWDRDGRWEGDFCTCSYKLSVPYDRQDPDERYAEHVLAELRKLQNAPL